MGFSARRSSLLVVLVAGLWSGSAFAQDFVHRGSLGLLVGAGGEYANVSTTQVASWGFRAPVDLGGTVSISDHNELMAFARMGMPATLDWSVWAGLRNSRGDRFKTFFDANLGAHFSPLWSVCARVAFGAQYELSEVVGLTSSFGIQFGYGQGFRLSFELSVGVQFRTYVL